MADRFWRGGTASWNNTTGTKWAATVGGAGGASVPTSADDVFFDATSGAVTCTIAGGNFGAKSINCTGFTGTLTGSAAITVSGNITFVAGMTLSVTNTITVDGTATLISGGQSYLNLTINGAGITVTLGDALSVSLTLIVTSGTFTTSNYNVTSAALSSNNSNVRAINLGSSTLTLGGSSPISFNTATNLTFNAGTSQINVSSATPSFNGGGVTFYNVSFTVTSAANQTINGVNTFNNLSFTGITAAGLKVVSLTANQTINGTLTLSAGTNATMRTFVRSDTIGTTRTLTCAAFSGTDADFRDITIAGAAAPVSGTRLGDCKGNSGITFGAGVTKYWNLAAGGNWSGTGWAATSGGTPAANDFPLAQDTALFEATGLNSGSTVTINAAFNIGTIDMSARTSNTMTLAIGTQQPQIYGNWINGTGTTLTGTGTMTFASRSSQTITSAGVTFTQALVVNAFGGSVVLSDALTANRTSVSALTLTAGTFNANGYNVSLVGAANGFGGSNNTNQKTIAIGSGTWVIAGSGSCWNITNNNNLTVTGTGTISLTSASAKTFTGVNIQTWPTLNQGGTGTLTVVDSNKFINITNSAIGRVQFTGGTTNEFGAFNLNGVLGNLLPLGSTNTNQAILRKSSAWLMGANSTDGGNNTGLSFTAGGGIDYLSVSYINGAVVSTASGNFFLMF